MILQRLGIPIYLQVKTLILDKIKAGDYQPGSKLPTERELASNLGISRNTVSAAYKELLLEGALEARQGRGTFVKQSKADDVKSEVAGSRRERVLKSIDAALANALELGFTVEQFLAFVNIRTQERTTAVKQLRVAVIACAIEYVHHFIDQIKQVANVHFEPVILAELISGKVPAELLQACDVVVTTGEHRLAVEEIMGSSNKLVTVSAVPNLDAVIKMARLPENTRVGVIACSKEYGEVLRLIGKKINENLRFELLTDDHRDEVLRFVADHSVLVVAEELQMRIRQLLTEGQEVIDFMYEIDQGSLHQLAGCLIRQTAG